MKRDSIPVFEKPRRLSLEQLKWLEEHISQMVDLGMLKRVENPIWGVPVFVVKKGTSWRMVADFRAVNSRTHKNSLPLPLLEQVTAEAALYL